jgi:hypothetical protein
VGCTYGLNTSPWSRQWEVLRPDQSLQTHVNRIAERADKAWNLVHREVHGLGAWDGKTVGPDAQLFAACTATPTPASATDPPTARTPQLAWASVRDRLVDASGRVLYARYNAEATQRSMDYVLAKCAAQRHLVAVLPQNLEDEAYMENAAALVASYERRFKVAPGTAAGPGPSRRPRIPRRRATAAGACTGALVVLGPHLQRRRWTWQAWLACLP